MSFVKTVSSSVLSLDLTTLLIFLLVLLVAYLIHRYVNGPKLPPGPPILPIFGSTFFFDKNARFWKETQRLSIEYKSDIITLDVYGRLLILLQSYDVAREAFHKRDDMTDRAPRNFLRSMESNYKGILASSGQVWKDQRRFTLFMLRDFGMGKIAAEQAIQDEILELCRRIEEINASEGSFDPLPVLEPAISNVICALAFGKRYDYDDKDFNAALDSLNRLLAEFTSWYSIMMLSPFLSWLVPYVLPKQYKRMNRMYTLWCNFIRNIINEHRETFDGTVNDIIDGYFAEQKKRIAENDTSFTDIQLRQLIQDLFLAGSETTTTTLRWAFLFLLKYPNIQEKIYDELVNNIGNHTPNMGDKKNTPYTEAFLLEVQRYNTIVPNSVGHSNSVDIEFRGYTIPAGSYITSNLAAIHRDPKVFADPDTFNVERFLENGKVVNADKVNQFGIGRRACAGEALARMEVYLFFVTIILKYKMEPVSKEIDTEGGYGSIYAPNTYRIKVSKRLPTN